jgi:quercetin dioxygenase-like cupin family protein
MKTATGQELWFLDTRVSFPVSHEDGSDGVSVMSQWGPEGHSPPLHVHEDEDEVFHLLQGRLSFRVGDETPTLEAGETLLAPKGVPHTFVVESTGGAAWLVVTARGDFERFVRSCSRPDGPAAPDPERLAAAAAAHGVAIVGPPLR